MPEVCYTKNSAQCYQTDISSSFFWLGMSLRTSCSLNPLILHTATFFVTQFIKTPTALLQEWSLQPTGLLTTGETLYVDRQWAVWMRLPRLSRRGLRTHTLLTDPGSNDFGRHLFCDAFVNSMSCMLKHLFMSNISWQMLCSESVSKPAGLTQS